MRQKDDWPLICRRRGIPFNDAEVRVIEQGYREGRGARDVARQLGCSSRVIHTRFYNMRGGPTPRGPRGPKMPKTPRSRSVIDRASRFYHSNFEPS